jgi:hypothetical protein
MFQELPFGRLILGFEGSGGSFPAPPSAPAAKGASGVKDDDDEVGGFGFGFAFATMAGEASPAKAVPKALPQVLCFVCIS